MMKLETLPDWLCPSIKIYLLPGGIMPERQTDGAIGYDAHIRAVVSPTEDDPENPNFRKTLFDFKTMPDDLSIESHVLSLPTKNGGPNELIYRMAPLESVLVGIGFATDMPFPLFYWMAPRGGLSSRWNITVTNAPGTIDPDYRGEAGALVYNRSSTTSFDLRYGMRIAQIIFQWAVIPKCESVSSHQDLASTVRGAGGFGSTGLF